MSESSQESQEPSASDEWYRQWNLIGKATGESLAKMMATPEQQAWHKAWVLMGKTVDQARAAATERKLNQSGSSEQEPSAAEPSIQRES